MPSFLAIDQSTSATKALLFDEQGALLDKESIEHAQLYPKPGYVEHDAEEIWQNSIQACRNLLQRNQDKAQDVASLSISNQRETVVVFDKQSGKPLYNAIVWQCRRGVEICEEHKTNGREAEIHQKTGLKLDAYFSASKLQWLVRNNQDIKAKLENGTAVIGTIDAFLIYHLTGGQVFACDHTNASRTLLYNISELDWDDELCNLWEIPRRALPALQDSTATFGKTSIEGILPEIPICGVMGDSHASLFAQRCFQSGTTKVTFGTGSSILMNIGNKPVWSEKGVVTTLAWVHKGNPVYAFEGIIISAAATLSWLKSQLGIFQDYSETETMATDIHDNGGVYFVPAFSGLGLPHWVPGARATISGLSGQSDRRHLVRAAFEAIAYQLKDALEAMRADAGIDLKNIHADGGPTANQFLMQFTSDISGMDLHVSQMPDCSPLGATMAGMLGSHVYQSIEELQSLPRHELLYTPSMNPELSENLYRGWLRAVRRSLPEN